MKSFLTLLLLLIAGSANAQLQWRISIKVFTDSNGALPRIPGWGLGGVTLFQELSNGVRYANNVLAGTGRGYSWQLTEIVTVPGTTAPLPAMTNSWFRMPVNAAAQDDLDTKVKSNAAGFQYRTNAVNFYYIDSNLGSAGGSCAFPPENQHVIPIAPNSFADVLIHEAGHFFDLKHTHNTERSENVDDTICNNANVCSCARFIPGDDGIADTLLDHQCFTRDQIASNTFDNRPYDLLDPDEKAAVDNTWLNIMSYHSPGLRFTDDQMDFLTDVSNTSRFNVATGRTRFVDRNHAGNQDGSRASPFRGVGQAIVAADAGDIVLIRPGHYQETATYAKPVTLRATRGSASIGRP